MRAVGGNREGAKTRRRTRRKLFARQSLQVGRFTQSTQRRRAHREEEKRSNQKGSSRLQQAHAIGSKGFTKAGIRKMIARLHEELAAYEGSEEARGPEGWT